MASITIVCLRTWEQAQEVRIHSSTTQTFIQLLYEERYQCTPAEHQFGRTQTSQSESEVTNEGREENRGGGERGGGAGGGGRGGLNLLMMSRVCRFGGVRRGEWSGLMGLHPRLEHLCASLLGCDPESGQIFIRLDRGAGLLPEHVPEILGSHILFEAPGDVAQDIGPVILSHSIRR
jgi:hypothetical protein